MTVVIPSLFQADGTTPSTEATQVPAKTEPKAPKEIVDIKQGEIEGKLKDALAKANINWPLMTKSAVACAAALSVVKMPTTDEEDAALEQVLVKAKKTYEKISGQRKETTALFDEIKGIMMQPEKSISTLAGDKDSPYHVGVGYRNKFANEKLQKKREEEAKALAKQNATIEISRLKGVFELLFNNNLIQYATNTETTIVKFFNGLELEKPNPDPEKANEPITWETQVKKFNMKPALKEETFDSWFNVDFDKTKLTQKAFDEFIEQVKKVYTYQVINDAYVALIQPKIDEWVAKLPEKKKELEDLKELAIKDAKAAQKLKAKQATAAEKQVEKITTSANEAMEEKAAEVKQTQNQEALSAQFENLKVTQTGPEINGKIKRAAIINCDPKDIANVFAQALFFCLIDENFEGYIKKDKTTGLELPPDENGIPQYTAWADTILSFVAEKTTHTVPGIDFKDVVSTSQRSKK